MKIFSCWSARVVRVVMLKNCVSLPGAFYVLGNCCCLAGARTRFDDNCFVGTEGSVVEPLAHKRFVESNLLDVCYVLGYGVEGLPFSNELSLASSLPQQPNKVINI